MSPSMHFPEKAAKKLLSREKAGNLRTLPPDPGSMKDFFSNDYLGLARSEELARRIQKRVEKEALPIQNGATGSRLLSGNTPLAERLEEKLARFFRAESALIFNSGFTANIGLLSCLPQKGDTVLYDEFAHASLKQGAQLSFARRYSFRHNDVEDLERKIKKSQGQVYVVVESIYSMDGDQCPPAEIVSLCRKYNALLILDEAHATGVFGEQGSGIACESGLEQHIFARIYTFGKAVGLHGACIVGSRKLKEYLINFSVPFIYTTAMPPHTFPALEESLNYMAENPQLRERLFKNIALFDCLTMNDSQPTPIKTIRISGNEAVKKAALELQKAGFAVMPVLAPTVPEGKERLRVSIHAHNTSEEIEHLVAKLSEMNLLAVRP